MADPVVWPVPGYPEDLGQPERIYRQATNPKVTTVLRLLLLLGLLLGIAYGAYLLIRASSQGTEAWRTFCLPIALLMLAFYALFLSAPALQRYGQLKDQRNDIAVICSGGLACYHDGAWHQAKWNEIAEIKTQEKTPGKDLMKEATRGGGGEADLLFGTIGGLGKVLGSDCRTYVITTQRGDQIKLGDTFTDIDKLVGTIQYRAEPAQLTSTQQVLESGRAVSFGSITITKDYLDYNKRNYSWDTIDCIEDEPRKTYTDPVSEMVLGGTIPVLRIQPRPTLPPTDVRRLFGGGHVDIPKQNVSNVRVLLTVAKDMIRLAKQSGAEQV